VIQGQYTAAALPFHLQQAQEQHIAATESLHPQRQSRCPLAETGIALARADALAHRSSCGVRTIGSEAGDEGYGGYEAGSDWGSGLAEMDRCRFGLEVGRIDLDGTDQLGLDGTDQLGLDETDQLGLDEMDQLGLDEMDQLGLDGTDQLGLDETDQLGLDEKDHID